MDKFNHNQNQKLDSMVPIKVTLTLKDNNQALFKIIMEI